MYNVYIIGNKTVTQHVNLSKKFAKQLALAALKRNNLVQVLTPNKKFVTVTLKDFLKNEF